MRGNQKDPMAKRSVVWRRIRELREKLELTQGQLADMAGMSRETISRIESGRKVRTSTDTVDRIARALRVPPGSLYDVPATFVSVPSIAPAIQRFRASLLARELKPPLDEGEIEWLISAGETFWAGVEPTDELLFLIVQSRRNRPAQPKNA